MNQKKSRISQILGETDPRFLTEAAPHSDSGENTLKKTKSGKSWLRIAAAAACIAVLAAAGAFALPLLRSPSLPSDITEAGDDPAASSVGLYTDSYYCLLNAAGSFETARIFPWEKQTVYEQYHTASLNGAIYESRVSILGKPFSSDLLDDCLGTIAVSGQDFTTLADHQTEGLAYRVRGINPSVMIAVMLDDNAYPFFRVDAALPDTLGELLSAYDLPHTLPLSVYTEGEKTLLLSEDEGVWERLAACADAARVDREPGVPGKDSLTFTVSSPLLGVYKNTFRIDADGTLTTNILMFPFTCSIGEEAASELLTYIRSVSLENDPEPYLYTFFGKVTAIEEGRMVLSDAIFRRDPETGFSVVVPTDDIRVSRWLDDGTVEVGSLIGIQYAGDAALTDGQTVEGICGLLFPVREIIGENGEISYSIEE